MSILIGPGVAPGSAGKWRSSLPTTLSTIIRREKWRLRPLKRLVLPFRNLKRRIITLDSLVRRNPLPRIERSTIDYLAGQGRGAAIGIYLAEPVQSLPHPFGEKEDRAGF